MTVNPLPESAVPFCWKRGLFPGYTKAVEQEIEPGNTRFDENGRTEETGADPELEVG